MKYTYVIWGMRVEYAYTQGLFCKYDTIDRYLVNYLTVESTVL